jgi:hypothetical protein
MHISCILPEKSNNQPGNNPSYNSTCLDPTPLPPVAGVIARTLVRHRLASFEPSAARPTPAMLSMMLPPLTMPVVAIRNFRPDSELDLRQIPTTLNKSPTCLVFDSLPTEALRFLYTCNRRGKTQPWSLFVLPSQTLGEKKKIALLDERDDPVISLTTYARWYWGPSSSPLLFA